MRLRKKGLTKRQARRIRRGLTGARMAHEYGALGDWDKAAEVYWVVHAFGGITCQALYREYARLTIND